MAQDVQQIISIHAPAKGATLLNRAMHLFRFYFNPRSREGSDAHGCDACCAVIISIHAPAKGATICKNDLDTLVHISIHAPAKGATSDILAIRSDQVISIHAPAKGATYSRTFSFPSSLFQSTLPRRERLRNFDRHALAVLISIHAPAKGATSDKCLFGRLGGISIHAPAKGATSTA